LVLRRDGAIHEAGGRLKKFMLGAWGRLKFFCARAIAIFFTSRNRIFLHDWQLNYDTFFTIPDDD